MQEKEGSSEVSKKNVCNSSRVFLEAVPFLRKGLRKEPRNSFISRTLTRRNNSCPQLATTELFWGRSAIWAVPFSYFYWHWRGNRLCVEGKSFAASVRSASAQLRASSDSCHAAPLRSTQTGSQAWEEVNVAIWNPWAPSPPSSPFPKPPVLQKYKPHGRCSSAFLLHVPTQTSEGEPMEPSLKVSPNTRSFCTPKTSKKVAFQTLHYSCSWFNLTFQDQLAGRNVSLALGKKKNK